ncbi:hypothetical protein HOB30_02390, partial [Candidatus Falkowbacteria bacterium]|nr:hypothetical protein [Candidatus Falkowbacteria bacterium]
MNKKYLVGVLIFAFLIVGAACTKDEVNNDLGSGVANQAAEVTDDNGNDQAEHADWQTYSNSEYGFKLMYPATYKTVAGDSGWPNSVVHFIENSGSPQAYRATVSIWDNLDDYRASTVYSAMRYYSHNNADGKKVVKSYSALGVETDLIEEWEEIIDTFAIISINDDQETVTTTNCTKPADLINKYGCNPGMTCGDGEVCREGLCVEEADAPNEYGCHPSMMCDKGQECRKGV